jgi:uncharacterized delta-60 repeat protein
MGKAMVSNEDFSSTTRVERILGAVVAAVFLLALTATPSSARPGDLDASFGSGGTVARTFNDGGDNRMWSMALAPDQKIVGAGACSVPNGFAFCIARYLPNGQLDPSFNGNGKLIDPIGSGLSHGRAVGVQSDGRIVVAGFCKVDDNFQFCMRRYLPDGTADVQFNSNVPAKPFPSYYSQSYGNHLVIQGDGKIVVAADGFHTMTNVFASIVARFLPNGRPDLAFSADGVAERAYVSNGANQNAFVRRLALHSRYARFGEPSGFDSPNGILLIGRCDVGLTFQNCVRRLHHDGSGDGSFGDGQSAAFEFISGFGNGDGAWAAIPQPDGKLIVIGDSFKATEVPSFGTFIARVDANGKSFDTQPLPPGTPSLNTLTDNGYIVDRVIGHDLFVRDALLDPNGKIVIAGTCKEIATSKYRACVLRYNNDGTRDTSFSRRIDNGLVHFDIGSGDAPMSHLLRQHDGKYLIGGSCVPSANVFDFCLARLEGGPFGYRNCKLDLDGDGRVLSSTDGVLMTRVTRGITGDAVFEGTKFAPNATRTTWNELRQYLVTHCGMKIAR